MTLKIRLLGLPQIDQEETAVTLRGQKPLALLAYLLLTEKSQSRQHLMDLLHEDTSDPRASLRWTLYHLRQGIGDDYLAADRQAIGLKATAEIWCDVPHFLAGDLELYRGDLLTDLDMPDSPRFMEWLFFERERLRTHYQNALAAQLQASEAKGDYPSMVAAAHKLLQLDNLREEWLRAAMRGYAALGKRQAALAEYERGREQLQMELGVEPATATIALYEEIKQPPASTTAVTPRPTLHSRVRAHNLPATATLFFGREEEQTRLETLLNNPDYRLVTLTGEGGCGKTRLAVTMAHRLLPAFAQGAWFVPLADVNPAEAGSMPVLAQAIAGALRFTFSQRPEPEQQLLDYLRQKEMLLLLDNCEHLDKEVDWLVELLQEAATVTLLATSRTPLRLQAEYIVPLDGLPVPELTEPPATIRAYSSIQLFDERASRTGTQLNLQNGHLADVVRICHSVQGLPLGIELAAAWANQVSPPVILRQIEADLDFLATTMRDVPARHRSLRAIFNTSWQLLTEAEQQALAQLAVFRGGFDATAAAAIANASTDRLNGLAEKSLLQVVDSDRYQMHPLMRQFAREKLDETAADTAVLSRHYHYYLQWVAAQAAALSGAEPHKAKTKVAVEMNNIRQAWNQALAAANLDLLLDSHHALTTYWRLAGLLAEGEDSLARAAARAKELEDQSVLGHLLVAQSYFHFMRGQPENALQTAQEALALAEQLEDSLLAAAAHLRWGYTALLIQGDEETAQTQFEQASTLLETQSSNRTANLVAEVHHGLGIIFMNRSQAELAQQHLQSAIDLYRQQEDRLRESSAQMVLGVNAMSSGQYEQAREIFQEVLATKQAIEDRYGEISVLGNLPAPYFYQGYYSEARRYYLQVLHHQQEIGARSGAAHSWHNVADVSLCLGDLEMTHRYATEALRLTQETGLRRVEVTSLLLLGHVAFYRGQPEEALSYVAQAAVLNDQLQLSFATLLSAFLEGQALAALERWEAAKQAYARAAEVESDFAFLKLYCEAGIGLVHLAQGELAALRSLADKIVVHLEEQGPGYYREPLWLPWAAYQLLTALNDKRADTVLATARDLLTTLTQRIGSEEERQLFLQNIPTHRALCQLIELPSTS